MQPPNVENLFMAGGVVFFFDPGTGERDLGLIEEPPDVEPKSTEVKVYSNRSGKRRLVKTFTTEEEVVWTMKLQELVAANLQAFFKGGPLEVVGAGSAQVVDQKLVLSGELPVSTGKYGVSAVTVRQFLDRCLAFDGAAYTDRTSEADSLAGTPFDLLVTPDDYLYFGKVTKFKELYLDLAVTGNYTGVTWEYWNGTAWVALITAGAGQGLDATGKVNWTVPDDWAATLVNDSDPLFWVRVKCTAVTTVANCNCVRQDAVKNTDYIVDPGQVAGGLLNGRLARLAAGFLADGEEVKVSYTYTTWSSLRFPVAGDNYQQGAARLQFRPSRGFQWNYVIPKCQLKPNGKLVLDDKKPMELPVILEVLDASATNPEAPYGYWECLNES
jgi:hypothetical protein